MTVGRWGVALVFSATLGTGGVCPATASELPADASVIMARVRGDAIVVWDATDELLALLSQTKSKRTILRALESEAARLLSDRAAKIMSKATSVTVDVTYKRTGAISPVYKAATLEGVEELLKLKAPIAAATARNTWPADIAAGKHTKNLNVTVVGSLPPDVK